MEEDHGTAQHEPVPPGARRRTGSAVPRAGTWEMVRHEGCGAGGTLEALAPDRPVPACTACGQPVDWQLTHLAPSVAADHRGVGPLP